MTESAPKFCPFCREYFDDVSECPDHGLALVSFGELPATRARVPEEGERLPAYDLRFGRGGVFAGVGILLFGFALPFVDRDGTTRSALEMAVEMATNLWTVAAVAAADLAIVLRRRTLVEMRAARAVIPALSILAAASICFTLWRILEGAEHIRRTYGMDVEISILSGAWVMGAGLLLTAVFGALLGRTPRG